MVGPGLDHAILLHHLCVKERRHRLTYAPQIKSLADKLASVSRRLGARTEALSARLDVADQKHEAAVSLHHGVLDQVEAYTNEIENLARQMSNGGPPLDPSPAVQPAPGVTLNAGAVHRTDVDNNGVGVANTR